MPETGSAPPQQIAQFRSDGITAATGLRIPFFSDDFSRAYGLPPARIVNMMSEATPLREERPYVPLVGLRETRYSRPGLVPFVSCGSGPIRGMAISPPFLLAIPFFVSGNTFYDANGTARGSCPGTDRVRFAASASQMVAVSEGVAYLCDDGTGGVFTPFPLTASWIADGSALPPVSDVAWIGDRFVYSVLGTSMFYYSEVNDAANVPGLNFESTEATPAPILGLTVWNDQLCAFTSQSVEFFALSGSADAPFTPQNGLGFQRGCASRDAIAYADNAIFWVGENRVVYRSAPSPTRISSNSIEDKLRQCADISTLSAFVVSFEGHELYVLTIPGVGTYAYDISRIGTTISTYGDSYSRGEWDEWQSWGAPVFRGQAGIMAGGVAYVGDNASAAVFTMKMGVYTDAGGPLVRQVSSFIKIEEGNPRCLNFVLQCVAGVGNPSGAGMNPVAEMRFSDDLGGTFTAWRETSLGVQGGYATRAMWQRLGRMRAPGRLVEIRVSDPVNACFSHLELNASRPAW